MIKKYNEIKEIENATIGITQGFAKNEWIHKETTKRYKEGREVEEEEN